MPKRYNIRWQQDDVAQLNRAVRNFNAKITRLEKKDPKNKTALPEKISARQLKELIETRQDLKREINSLQRFTKRGAEEIISVPDNDYNLTITKWQFKEMNMRNAIINRKRKKRREEFQKIEMESGGKGLGYTLGDIGMGKAEENSLKPTSAFTKKMNRADLNMRYKHFLKESQSSYFEKIDERFRETYINTLKRSYNEADIKEVIESVKSMDYKEFYNKIQAQGGVKAALEWGYPPKPGTSEYTGFLEELHDQWVPDWFEKHYNLDSTDDDLDF